MHSLTLFYIAILQTPESAWDKIFDINVKCAFLLTQEALPLLERSSSPSIVYISSIAAYQTMPVLFEISIHFLRHGDNLELLQVEPFEEALNACPFCL